MLSCVTRGSTTPGVQIGSGSPLTEWHCAVGVLTLKADAGLASLGSCDCRASTTPSPTAIRQTISRTSSANRRFLKFMAGRLTATDPSRAEYA
jgi:hypothetical protein